MAITLDDTLAEAALRAAAKAGYSDVVDGLIKAGVDPDAMFGAALSVAERYGDIKTIDILRKATTDRAKLYKQGRVHSGP
jgi:hypothetical protein